MKISKYDRVRIKPSRYYNGKLNDLYGTVEVIYDSGNIGIVVDNLRNPRSSYGLFYLSSTYLEVIEGEESIMEGNYRIATVEYLDGANPNTYKYAVYDPTIGVGDKCLGKSAHHGFSLVVVTDIGPKTKEEITREIICKLDFSAYDARVENRKRTEELLALMSERAAALQKTALFKILAESDTEMAQMLSEYTNRMQEV